MLKRTNTLIIFFYLIIAFVISGLFLGFENLSFTRNDWILGSGDKTNSHIAWTFFRNDIWHFPIGKNPNYGLDIANSIIFTDSIPILAFIFKALNFFLPKDFQYLSFWVFLCFFLQLYFSYLLINFITKNIKFSLLCSFLFILLPFYLFRLDHHLALGAHWLFLMAFYFNLSAPQEKKFFYWFGIILISLLIHLYLTAMLIIMYLIFSIKEILINQQFKKKFLEFSILFIIIFLLMFVAGYFESSPVDAISRGYGVFKADFFSIIDPAFNGGNSWSFFIDDLWPSHLEGFNYIGLGNIGIFLFLMFTLIKNSKKEILKKINNNFDYITLLLIFSIWAFTTNFSILGTNVFEIPISNKYLYGLLSIFASTGRFLWPAIYILMIFSIINIFRIFKNDKKYYAIIILLIVQLTDVYPKIKSNFFEKQSTKLDKPKFNDSIWKIISKDYAKLRTTYLFNNYGPIFNQLSYFISGDNIKSTDIMLNASMSRVKAAEARYNLYDLFNKGLVSEDTAYIVDNIGHLKHLKHIFANSDIGFFYRNNLWIILPNKKNSMTKDDIENIDNINFDQVESNKIYQLNFSNKENFLGLGWTHNFDKKKGAWSEGKVATLMLNLDKLKKNKYAFTSSIEKYSLNKNNDYKLKVFVNNELKTTINLNQKNTVNMLKFNIDKNEISSSTLIDFKFEGLVSPFDIKVNPDARKLGILIKNFSINELK